LKNKNRVDLPPPFPSLKADYKSPSLPLPSPIGNIYKNRKKNKKRA